MLRIIVLADGFDIEESGIHSSKIIIRSSKILVSRQSRV